MPSDDKSCIRLAKSVLIALVAGLEIPTAFASLWPVVAGSHWAVEDRRSMKAIHIVDPEHEQPEAHLFGSVNRA